MQAAKEASLIETSYLMESGYGFCLRSYGQREAVDVFKRAEKGPERVCKRVRDVVARIWVTSATLSNLVDATSNQ